jgi:predicted nucleotidyltransferase
MRLENSILKVLVYFDLFNYPVTKQEIQYFLDEQVAEEELAAALEELLHAQCVFYHGGFYTLQDEPFLAVRRRKGNDRAADMLVTAHRISKFLYRFPFVRGIGISGSLSKNFADEKSDIDFFVITRANRLWLARTFMHLYKKLTFITGRQHWYCMNYYVDEEALQINEKNVFTATELITLMPVCGNGALDKFFHVNEWARSYYPNYEGKPPVFKEPGAGHRLKRLIEILFSNRLGDRLDDYFMKTTARRWRQKEEKSLLNARGVKLGLDNGKHYSKPNPVYFHNHVLQMYQRRLAEYKAQWNKINSNINA